MQVRKVLPGVRVEVFSDRDIRGAREAALEQALASADVFFGSLLFDYDDVEWIKARVGAVPLRFAFESALELMSETRVGEFEMVAPEGKKAGPPPAVKRILELFGSGKEEDKLAVRSACYTVVCECATLSVHLDQARVVQGYLSFLKIGPKILKFVPIRKAQDLRAWCVLVSSHVATCGQPTISLIETCFRGACSATSMHAGSQCMAIGTRGGVRTSSK